jgi:hypothetical protein
MNGVERNDPACQRRKPVRCCCQRQEGACSGSSARQVRVQAQEAQTRESRRQTLDDRFTSHTVLFLLENTICHGQKSSTMPVLPENTVPNAILDIGHDHL